VGAINGTAAGGGMSLALACDIVLAAESATFLQAFTKIGLVPDCGSTWFLPRMVGDVRARALIMMADKITARDALQYGLVWKVHADAALMSEARKSAEWLAKMPTRAYDMIKQALAASQGNGLGDQLEIEAMLQGQAVRTKDHREGVTAFLEKRPAKFIGE
jgi:2-(1,2-epoxy-1,2-dihydrophenyl)acetyl-CoA isomerase